MPEMIPPQEGQQQIDPNRFAMAKSIMADNAKASQLPTGLETELDVSQFPELKDKKEGDICLGRGTHANVFIVSGQGVLPVYGIQGDVEKFLKINTGQSQFLSEELGSRASAGNIGYSDMIFKGNNSTKFTVKNLYYGPR